ncbi:SusC/RagA family TonB-linked outer membrane protein [Flavobacterium sp.]|uniref:SusC/RagA family TonB-linked outer membrane protein n=1 Tax=Flavobacterium sp. TaxID=239 RepID=UPI00375301E1
MKTIYKKLLFLILLLPATLLAQSSLEGVVLDSKSKQPLPGVNVVIQGTATGTSTDFDGKFKLGKVKSGDKIVFSFIGYKEQIVQFNNQKSISVSLEEEANQLQEVVVQIGYGSVKKKDATGSVTTITSKDFVKGPVVAVDQMIQGKVAGLQVTNGGGSPGEGATIRIRGGSSLSANNDPLFVIDGIPVANGGINGGRNPLATINQNNIESVTVLKDASATAIYGSRASNGVIIITTKKGKTGDLKVEYNSYLSLSQVDKKVDALSSTQFRDFITANGNASQQALVGQADTDWQDEIYRTAIGNDHNVALSGGVENITYRASLGLADLNGILKRDNLFRSTIGLSLVGKFLDNHLKVELNNNSSSMRNNYSNRGAIGAAVSFDPTQSVFDSNGDYFQWTNNLAGRNPLSLINQFNNYGNSFRSIGNVQTEYKLHFLPELKLVANLGYDELSGRSYGNTSTDFAFPGAGNRYDSRNTRKNKLMDLFFNYNKNINSIKTVFDLTAGYTYQDFRDVTESFNYDAANDILIPNPIIPTRTNLQSFFARTNITIADKYLLTFSYRRDGSSRFTEENRWSDFPAAALAWKLNEEGLFKNIKNLSNLKLRFGWGITGQQDIGSIYPSIPLYLGADTGAQYQFGNQFFIPFRPQSYNSNLKWEETETRNIGLDFGFFKNRFNGTIDVYEKRTKDLLAFISNPPFFGFSNADFYNIGKMRNKGIELSAEVVAVQGENLNWRIGGNVTFQNSEIEDLFLDPQFFPGINTGGYSGGVGNTIQNHQVGYAPNSFYVYEQAYDLNGSPIDGVFIDRNGDGAVNEQDKYRYKKPAADVFYGFSTSLNYKNWDLAMSWRGSWGNYNYNNVDSQYGWTNQLLVRDTDLSNGVTNVLETDFSSTDVKRYESDYYIQDASFVRLDNLTLGYNFKNFMSSKTNVKISFAGQNLLLFTNYKGIDPEVQNGIDSNLYPRPKIYTLGLNVNF